MPASTVTRVGSFV